MLFRSLKGNLTGMCVTGTCSVSDCCDTNPTCSDISSDNVAEFCSGRGRSDNLQLACAGEKCTKDVDMDKCCQSAATTTTISPEFIFKDGDSLNAAALLSATTGASLFMLICTIAVLC